MSLEKYIKSLGKIATQCEMCKDKSFGERFRWRAQQIIPSHIPALLTVCKKCIYREEFGSKKRNKAMKENLLKDFGNA